MPDRGNVRSLVQAASKARENAYSPYSGVKIGSAVLAADGRVFSGANVENASFGLSICAERAAVFRAVSEGAKDLVAIAIVGRSAEYTTPCGACRQVIAEFNPKMRVHRRGLDGFSDDSSADSLLPSPFSMRGSSKK